MHFTSPLIVAVLRLRSCENTSASLLSHFVFTFRAMTGQCRGNSVPRECIGSIGVISDGRIAKESN